MQLRDKVAIITGGGSGIGEATARLFASEGATVVIVDCNEKEALRVAHAINRNTGVDYKNKGYSMTSKQQSISVKTDVSVEEEVMRMVKHVLSSYGKIDIVFNNAATILPKALEEVEDYEWDRLIDVNLKSVFLLIKHTISELKKSRGAIVNMGSLNGLIGQRQNAVYAATKGGIIAMTKALALDYASAGVRVNCICPAGVETPLLKTWVNQQENPEEVQGKLNEMHALGRLATTNEIAQAALFLASNQSNFVTGVAFPVDGGASLGY